jgi:hypothetical protein
MTTRSRPRVTRACVIVLLVLAAGCAGTTTHTSSDRPAAPVPAHAPPEVLGDQATRSTIAVTPYERQAFLEIAMEPAVNLRQHRAVLQRWARDPTFAVAGTATADDLRRVTEAAQRWSFITGRHVTITAGPADVVIHFVPRAEFAAVLGVAHVDPTAVGLTRVSFAPGRRGDITGGIVVVASDDDQVTRNRTIAHELGHALGLQHSTCASSLMDGSSDGERSVRWSPSALDIRMGSLLYDPRLAPGLGESAVAAILPPSAVDGAVCGPVDLELVRAAGTGRHYLCARSPERVRPCTSNVSTEPRLPLVNPDAWTDGSHLTASPPD